MSNITTREWKALAGIGAVILGVALAAPFVDTFPMVAGGLVTVAGGIVATSQVEVGDAEVDA